MVYGFIEVDQIVRTGSVRMYLYANGNMIAGDKKEPILHTKEKNEAGMCFCSCHSMVVVLPRSPLESSNVTIG